MTDDHEQYPPHTSTETAPAFRGLIMGAIILCAILFAIVKLTNAHYAHAEPAAAETTK